MLVSSVGSATGLTAAQEQASVAFGFTHLEYRVHTPAEYQFKGEQHDIREPDSGRGGARGGIAAWPVLGAGRVCRDTGPVAKFFRARFAKGCALPNLRCRHLR